jgi:hypothetical protein
VFGKALVWSGLGTDTMCALPTGQVKLVAWE